jgi:hypothetical protein
VVCTITSILWPGSAKPATPTTSSTRTVMARRPSPWPPTARRARPPARAWTRGWARRGPVRSSRTRPCTACASVKAPSAAC